MGGPSVGALLVQLGTPDSPSVPDVRRYLAEFLADPRVIDLPAPLRALLLHGYILRVRPPNSAAAYRQIWTPQGSPLRVYSENLVRALGALLHGELHIALGMRYGAPGIDAALSDLARAGVRQLIVWPLFPQYSNAANGSALARVFEGILQRGFERVISIGPFHADAGFCAAWTAVAAPALAAFRPDHVLFSYHGLPERQIRAADPSGRHCLASSDCCAALGPANRLCYRAQCHATSRDLGAALALPAASWSTAFQSRLGPTRWIEPYTDVELPRLHAAGVRRLAVLCPAFVADCLETLEEIGIRARAQWQALGGEDLLLVPSLNAHRRWVDYAAQRLRSEAQALRSDSTAASPEASESPTPTPAT